MIKIGTWKTRNGEDVCVDYVGNDGCSGWCNDFDEDGNILGCIDLQWDLLGNDLDRIRRWDLVQLIKEAHTEIRDGNTVLVF
jgi:hypothetical protein